MVIQTINKKNNILRRMFIYWISVIIWQTFRPVANRSLIDSAMKVMLLMPLVSYGYKHQNTRRFGQGGGLLFFVFFITQILTIVFDCGDLGLGSLITVVFMMVQIIVFLLLLREEKADFSMLEYVCKGLIIVAVIMSLYNVIFEWNTFRLLFSMSSGAYGGECSSFLYSNHEFGLYLSGSFLSMIWLYLNKKLKAIYAFGIGGLLLINLLSTYSRTAILGVIIAFFILLFAYDKKKFTIIGIVGVIALVIILNNDMLYQMFFRKIMKGSFTEGGGAFDEGRSSMYAEEWAAFRNGSMWQLFFGQGYGGAAKYGGHDAYLIILLTGGIIMFAFFAFIILYAVGHSLRVLKRDKLMGALLFGYQVFALMYMVAQTPILFYSSMDCFFITMICILIPMYISNGITSCNGGNYENSSNQLRL